ncbi:hypothetical protein [Conexibacter sp. S30A1]|uniref:WD40/YVTN/BNR-like repeat-containing protein n=1 Tax=Conexibacter sp. S30A1 TaxID=2937800 RepID=UPI00200F4F4E|nr:hypothetical protein [Conexibacter sp. S30A1]
MLTAALLAAAASPAVRAGAAEPVPQTVRATLVRPGAGTREPPVGTAVRLSQVDSIEFATEQVGYALGGPQGSTFPLKTTDGGHRWFIDGPAFFLPVADGAASVSDMAATSATEAYAYGGQGGSSIVMTTDAGKRWWRTYLGQAVVAVSQHGSDIWALAAGPETPSSGVAAVAPMWLYDSSDGGRSRTYRSTLPDVRGWEADLVRPSANTAFALIKGFGLERASEAGIVQTTNGGETWIKRSDPCEQQLARRGFGFTERLQATSPTSLWLFCGTQPSTGAQAKLVERSSNSGQTWTLIASNAPGEHVRSNDISAIGTLPDTGTTGYLSVTSPSDAWLILIGNSMFWKTTDGGHTWTAAAPSKIEAQFPQEFSLAQQSIFVKTQNALWKHSADGWTLVAGTPKPY